MARDHYIRSPKWFDFEEGYDSYTRGKRLTTMVPTTQTKQEPELTRLLGVSTRTEASARTLPHARSIHAQSGSVRSIPFTPTTSWSKDPGDRWRKAWEAKHLKMKVNQGTAYPCNPSTLEKHELKPENCRKRHWSAPEATRLLEILLNLGRPNDEAQDKAIRRLADGMRVTTWSGDLVIKAFEDLDSTFFGGYLTDEVMVQWCSEDAFRGGPPAFGVCFSMNPSSSSRVKIHLNADEIFLRSDDPWKVMWRTIIHEMVVSAHGKLFYVVLTTTPACVSSGYVR